MAALRQGWIVVAMTRNFDYIVVGAGSAGCRQEDSRRISAIAAPNNTTAATS